MNSIFYLSIAHFHCLIVFTRTAFGSFCFYLIFFCKFSIKFYTQFNRWNTERDCDMFVLQTNTVIIMLFIFGVFFLSDLIGNILQFLCVCWCCCHFGLKSTISQMDYKICGIQFNFGSHSMLFHVVRYTQIYSKRKIF